MRQEYDSTYHHREGVGVLFALLPKHNVCLLRANDASRDASVPYREIAEPQRGATIQFHSTGTGIAPPLVVHPLHTGVQAAVAAN